MKKTLILILFFAGILYSSCTQDHELDVDRTRVEVRGDEQSSNLPLVEPCYNRYFINLSPISPGPGTRWVKYSIIDNSGNFIESGLYNGEENLSYATQIDLQLCHPYRVIVEVKLGSHIYIFHDEIVYSDGCGGVHNCLP